MNKVKIIVLCFLCGACFIGANVLVWFSNNHPTPTPTEQMLFNVLLFILSSVFAIITGYYFARITNSEKVDTIAERSTEKMVHLSLQLHHLKGFLEDTDEVAEEQQNTNLYAGLNAYHHRTVAAADMAGSLASSNEAFRSDWLGVVSDKTRKRIEEKYEALRKYMQDFETIQKLQLQTTTNVESDGEEQEVREKLEQAEKRIESIQQSLPIQAAFFRHSLRLPAVEVEQITSKADLENNSGTLRIKVVRPVFMATGSGKLIPPMKGVPELKVQLLHWPTALSFEDFKMVPGTGTNYDFNIALKSTAYGLHLPLGEYVFNYRAIASESSVPQTVGASNEHATASTPPQIIAVPSSE